MSKKKTFSRKLARLGILSICLLFLSGIACVTDAGAEDAVVLVNSMSADYDDFQHYIKPYLDNFGISYATLDISSEPVGAAIGDYNLIIVGHRQLDPDDAYLDPTEETNITLAVNAGTGLLNFDNDLSGDGATPRYQFIDDIFGFSYTSPPSASGVTFTSEGYTGIRINCWEDDHQEPVLTTTENVPDLVEDDGQWTEFLYTSSRPYPSILAGEDEENYGLPVMRFYTSGIPNGQYEVIANLYTSSTGRDMRYYYGYTPGDPKANFVDTVGGAGGSDQHEEYSLGTVDVTDGTFNIYVQDADLTGTGYPFFGWAWINLVPTQEVLINCWEDDHQDPVLTTTEIPGDIIEDDGAWTEFLYTPRRPYPTILAGVDEETLGLPPIHFFASGIPSGEYEVLANLYTSSSGRDMRYYYGFTPGDPKANYVDTVGGAGGFEEHEEYSLGTVNITDGNFDIYVQDADLLGGTYPFFGWAWVRLVETGSGPPPSVMHYITERHDPGDVISTGTMTLAGITTPETVSNLAMSGSQPFLSVTTSSSGNAVQFGTYNWMSHAVKGPVYGLDDLVWRSIVWAARKPFVMQGLPPFLTMRVDDESGPFDWIHTANEFGFKPWAGLFFHNIDPAEAADLSSLVNAGLATTAIHAFNGGFFYFDHSGTDLPDATIAAHYAEGTQWHLDNNIPISKFVLPHYYELGTNAFQGLSDWGVEFVGTVMDPGYGYRASDWIMNGPYRLYEANNSGWGGPLYYADFMTIPGHPEFDGQFFNCMTEIRDDAGYEWYPSTDVAGSIGRGTRQTIRSLDSMVLATLFTHDQHISPISQESWRAILAGITSNVAHYNPIYVTLDHACQYIRAIHTSDILDSTYDPVSRQVTTTLTGETDMDTMFYLFTEVGETIQHVLVDVPTFSGTADVVYQLAGPLDHVTVTPSTTIVAIGGTQQFTAMGYDADDNPIPNLPFSWNVASGGGTINASGLFTAGMAAAIYTDTVVASYSGIEGYASVEVVEPALDHFTFDFIYSPQYIDIPFMVTITARDISGNPMIGYTGQASLADSTGTITPTLTSNFVSGEWTGEVAIGQLASDITITASDGLATGISNIFYVENIPGYYDVTSPSYTQTESIPFPVTVTENAIRINCWEDDHQDPFLYTFYDSTQFVPDDNLWDEFHYNQRDYPGVFASQTENPEIMRFYGAVPNGSYRVIANLYRTNDFRYYYGFDSSTPRQFSVDVTTGPIGDFAEFDLGIVTITDNMFSLYTDHADVITDRGSFPYYGWAWLRLVPAQVEYQINCWEDDHQDPVLTTTQNVPDLVDNDGDWTEFLYPPIRNYPTILAGVDEEDFGLQVMRFYSGGIANGEYEVIANLYTSSVGRDMRYYFGYSSSDPKAYYVDTVGGAGGTDQHEEYSLGTVNITDGTFNIYVRDADLTGTGYNFFGWAWIRLVPISGDEQINCGEDDHQDPVLVTTTNPADLGETDGDWTEFLYTSSRPYPSILAGVNEEDYGLPMMRFYTTGVSNGEYEVIANLYTSSTGRDMRYFYGYTSDNPKASYVDTIGGTGGTEQHTEYSLGTVTITDGTFNIYVQDADLTGTGYPFFGWAWVRLVSSNDQTMITMTSSSSTMIFDGDEDGIFGEPGDNVKPLLNGAMSIMALDTTPDTEVAVVATDDFGLFGSTMYTIEAIPAVLEITNLSPTAYEIATLQLPPDSTPTYIDRGYWFIDAPEQYVGLPFIRTAINDRYNNADQFLSFTVNKPVRLYICFSANALTGPDWLENNFTPTGEQISRLYHTWNVWQSNELLFGDVILGGNMATGVVANGGTLGMFVAIIEELIEPECTTAADCDDGVFCNGNEACIAGGCQLGNGPCPGQLCDEATEDCYDCFTALDCDDGVYCNGDENCAAGACEPGIDPCPGQLCDETGGVCADCLSDADCDDTLFCNGSETCVTGVCQPGGDPCPGQICEETGGVCVDCLSDTDCDDTVFCNGDETCAAGACEPGSDPCPGQLCDETGEVCYGCVSDADCDDGEFCNGAEICDLGTCLPGAYPCPGQSCDEDSDSCVSDGDLEILNLSPLDYEVDIFELPPDNTACYIDRGYWFIDAPDYYVGAPFIRTANRDRRNTADDFLYFTVTKPVRLYVCYSAAALRGPDWLESSFTPTGEQIIRLYHTFDVWESNDLLVGDITLGGNMASGVDSGGSSLGMYVVIVDEQ